MRNKTANTVLLYKKEKVLSKHRKWIGCVLPHQQIHLYIVAPSKCWHHEAKPQLPCQVMALGTASGVMLYVEQKLRHKQVPMLWGSADLGSECICSGGTRSTITFIFNCRCFAKGSRSNRFSLCSIWVPLLFVAYTAVFRPPLQPSPKTPEVRPSGLWRDGWAYHSHHP